MGTQFIFSLHIPLLGDSQRSESQTRCPLILATSVPDTQSETAPFNPRADTSSRVPPIAAAKEHRPANCPYVGADGSMS